MNRFKRLAAITVIALALPVTALTLSSVEAQAARQEQAPLLTIPGNPEVSVDKGVKKRVPVEVTGIIEQGHDPAGGNFWVNGGKKKQYTIRYLFDLDDATQAELGKLAESGAKVTVKGTLKVWKDGSAAFDESKPIVISK
jgi:hypothetical protein